ncbi:radical SAM protein [bacterium]|nr:MAG: radical SAM protein [bacterium]
MKEYDLCLIDLPQQKNYAIVSPHRIVYGLNASREELNTLIEEEEKEQSLKVDQCKDNKDNMNLQSASIGLIPTFDCNLKCIYCYAQGGETKKTMSLKTMKSAIEAVARIQNNSCNQLDVYLVGGGEPLLPFELVREAIAFAKSLCKTVNIHVVTNGTFGNDVLQWLIINKVDVRISYDGYMHNIQRPFATLYNRSSKKIVRENIEALTSNNIPVIVQCIVSNNGLNSMRQTIDEVIAMGITTLKLEPVLTTGISRATKDMEPNPTKYAEALLNAIEYIAKLENDLKLDTGYFAEPSNADYCGIRRINKTITPDGLVTACVEVSKETDPYADPIIYGKLDGRCTVTNQQRLNLIKTLHYSNQEECAKCNLRFICQGGCPMASVWRSGFPPKKSSFTCAVSHKLIPELLLKIANNPKIAKVVFNDNANIKTC